MIEVEDVWALIDRFAGQLPPARRPLADAHGFTLAEEVVADRDCPPFDRSTVDGYAIRVDDASTSFVVVRQIAAGEFVRFSPGTGEAVRIFTGAALPANGLRVIMQEDARRDGDRIAVEHRGSGLNFCVQGEDFRAGEALVSAGTSLDAKALAVLASVGRTEPIVTRAPRILHFTTGDEIVSPESEPKEGQVRNANATMTRALVREFPVEEFTHIHLPDDENEAERRVSAAGPETFDVVLFSGGASVGDFDFTARFLDALGFERHGSSVNVRPGKPLIFASNGARVAFGLPGNPVSHFVCHHLFVARALARMLAREPVGLRSVRLTESIPGRPNPRVTFWPARLTSDPAAGVKPVPWNSSGHLASLLGVNALIRIAANAALPKPGDPVQILPVA